MNSNLLRCAGRVPEESNVNPSIDGIWQTHMQLDESSPCWCGTPLSWPEWEEHIVAVHGSSPAPSVHPASPHQNSEMVRMNTRSVPAGRTMYLAREANMV